MGDNGRSCSWISAARFFAGVGRATSAPLQRQRIVRGLKDRTDALPGAASLGGSARLASTIDLISGMLDLPPGDSAMRSLALVAGLFGLLFFGNPLHPAEIRGQQDPRFQAALSAWLDDDDATALPQLGALAAEDNRAAQVLLALIDVAPPLQGPWLATLPRDERNAVLRAPGGLSGRNWMQSAATDTLLAKLWVEQPTPEADAATARGFASMGEMRAARLTLYDLSRRQYHQFAQMADDPTFPPDMRYLIWREWSADPKLRARSEAEIAAGHPGDPQLARFDQRPIDPSAVNAWLAEAPLAAPLRSVCGTICPQTTSSCTAAAFVLIGAATDLVSGHIGLASLGTPSEVLIPTERWNGSARAHSALLRQSSARFASEGAQSLKSISAVDTCLATAIEEDAERFAR